MMVQRMRTQFVELLRGAGLLDHDDAMQRANRHSSEWPVVKACLAAGLYPNLVRVDAKPKRSTFFTIEHGNLKLHPGP